MWCGVGGRKCNVLIHVRIHLKFCFPPSQVPDKPSIMKKRTSGSPNHAVSVCVCVLWVGGFHTLTSDSRSCSLTLTLDFHTHAHALIV